MNAIQRKRFIHKLVFTCNLDSREQLHPQQELAFFPLKKRMQQYIEIQLEIKLHNIIYPSLLLCVIFQVTSCIQLEVYKNNTFKLSGLLQCECARALSIKHQNLSIANL